MKVYKNEQLNHIAYPMGGTGAGMICLNGRGNLRHFSLFAALHITNGSTLIVEGEETGEMLSGGENFSRGSRGQPYGCPRFKKSSFSSRFPFATVDLQDERVPLTVRITGWSPFIPNDEDNSGLPVAGVEYTLHNPGDTAVEGSLSLNMPRLFGTRQGGFTIPSRRAISTWQPMPRRPGSMSPGSEAAPSITNRCSGIKSPQELFRIRRI